MTPTRKLADVTSPVLVCTRYQLVVRPFKPAEPGQFQMVGPRPVGWNLALSWMVTAALVGLVVLLIA